VARIYAGITDENVIALVFHGIYSLIATINRKKPRCTISPAPAPPHPSLFVGFHGLTAG
jgi:hypothetical protein